MRKTALKNVPGGKRLALACAREAAEKKAENILVLDMRAISSIADYFVICSGASTRHVRAIAESIVDETGADGARCWHSEGWADGYWIVLDFTDVIVHVFHDDARRYYHIERLWGDAKTVTSQKPKAEGK
ncbi:MAG: ribosome silencing factor [Candidatus Aureabacteria bacterium]|nr:ribosome silencing factor [Candidatus Auribacterota bacterium]